MKFALLAIVLATTEAKTCWKREGKGNCVTMSGGKADSYPDKNNRKDHYPEYYNMSLQQCQDKCEAMIGCTAVTRLDVGCPITLANGRKVMSICINNYRN